MMYMLGILVAILLHAHMVLAVGECYTACKPRMLHGFVARRPANATYPSHLLEPVDASGLSCSNALSPLIAFPRCCHP